MCLTVPVRNSLDLEFSKFVDSIGNGAGPGVDLPFIESVDSCGSLLDFVFPFHILNNPLDCLTRAILAPTNRQVDDYNSMIVDRLTGPEKTYFAADSLREIEDAGLTSPDSILDYVARQPPPGLPPYSLRIKVGAVYRLLRNFSVDRGLFKNARVVIVNVGTRLVTVRISKGIAGVNMIELEDIFIPRITFTAFLPTASGHTLLRKQFPLAPAYATTFNSCHGLTFDDIGLDLTHPVFSHGQLYTAVSRIRHRSHARVRFRSGETRTVM